jgi:glycine/D-amino acid oxidase-like deaminating enzyme
MQKVISMGVSVLFGATIKSWEASGDESVRVYASVAEDICIEASKLLIATNAFTSKLLTDFPVQPARGQVLITEPIEGLQLRGTFHFDDGYYYWRNVGNRILIGGARNSDFAGENTFELATSQIVQSTLQAFLNRHVPAATNVKIEHQWSGIMGFTNDKKPQIIQADKNVWAVVACNGMGVALAPAIAELVVSQMFP